MEAHLLWVQEVGGSSPPSPTSPTYQNGALTAAVGGRAGRAIVLTVARPGRTGVTSEKRRGSGSRLPPVADDRTEADRQLLSTEGGSHGRLEAVLSEK